MAYYVLVVECVLAIEDKEEVIRSLIVRMEEKDRTISSKEEENQQLQEKDQVIRQLEERERQFIQQESDQALL